MKTLTRIGGDVLLVVAALALLVFALLEVLITSPFQKGWSSR